MRKVFLIGNPNVGKSTLFNSLTKSSEHTGNFHGVTVEEKHKIIKTKKGDYDFVDLPGIYSLSAFSHEEEISRDVILNEEGERIIIIDANTVRRNLYLALQLKELGLNFKILINNNDYFLKKGNRLDEKKLSERLGVCCEIVNAKKIKITEFEKMFLINSQMGNSLITSDNENKKLKNNYEFDKEIQNKCKKIEKNENFNKKFINISKNNYFYDVNNLKKIINNSENDLNLKNAVEIKDDYNKKNFKNLKNSLKNAKYLEKYVQIIENKYKIDKNTIILALNGVFNNIGKEEENYIKTVLPDVIKSRYDYIDEILVDVLQLKKDYVYGQSKLDKIILNPIVMSVGFLLTFFISIYAIFFLIGPWLSNIFITAINYIIVNPFMNFLYSVTDNIWILEFFNGGVFSSVITVLSFLPQVVLLFIFLTILEDSGLISRMCFVFDDFLTKLGLNGKAIYIMLLGLGCNTMATVASKNLNGKNLRIKSQILNPYISCMARLPIFVIIATAFFTSYAYFVVVGLYLLGLIVALIIAKVLNKTILKTETNELLLEFPPLRNIDINHVLLTAKTNALDMAKRIFGVVISVGIIIWILSHTGIDLLFTTDITESILYLIASKISFIFAPIGLNAPSILCALMVGILAKELIVSIFSIANGVSTIPALVASIVLPTSVIHFSTASAVSFLIFSLLYAPCLSTIAVIRKESGKFMMWFCLILSFVVAYMLSFVAYTILTSGFIQIVITLSIIFLIMFSICFALKKIKTKKCMFCIKNCNK